MCSTTIATWFNRSASLTGEVLFFPSNFSGTYTLRVCAFTTTGSATFNLTITILGATCDSRSNCTPFCSSFVGFEDKMKYEGVRFPANATSNQNHTFYSGFLYENEKIESRIFGHGLNDRHVHNLFARNENLVFSAFFNFTTNQGFSIDENLNVETLTISRCATKRDLEYTRTRLHQTSLVSKEEEEIVEPICTISTAIWNIAFQKRSSALNGAFNATFYSMNYSTRANPFVLHKGFAFSSQDRIVSFAWKDVNQNILRVMAISGLGAPRLAIRPTVQVAYNFSQVSFADPNFKFEIPQVVLNYTCRQGVSI
jgi:hypothetical protein